MTVGNIGFFDLGGETLNQPRNSYLFTLTQSSRIVIHWSGRYGETLERLPRSKELVFSTLARIRKQRKMREGVTVHAEQNLPIRKGSGASAAARSAAQLGLAHLIGPPPDRLKIIAEVAKEEGHWDNIAACVLGGFVYVPSEEKIIRHTPIPNLEELVIIPPLEKASTDVLRRAISTYHIDSQTAVEAVEKAGLVFVATGSLACEHKTLSRLVSEVTRNIPARLPLMQVKNAESAIVFAKRLVLRLSEFGKRTWDKDERVRSFGLGSINDSTHTRARAEIGAYGPYKHDEFLELSKRILKHGGYLRISGAGPNHIIAYDRGRVSEDMLMRVEEEERDFWSTRGFKGKDITFHRAKPSAIGARVTVSS
jgi:homoserine kinase